MFNVPRQTLSKRPNPVLLAVNYFRYSGSLSAHSDSIAKTLRDSNEKDLYSIFCCRHFTATNVITPTSFKPVMTYTVADAVSPT